MAIGTARMAHLSLPGSVLRVGVDFSEDPVVCGTIAAGHPVHVLFPGPGARQVSELPRDRPVTLIVLDGTWTQAHKLLKVNPALAALPRVAFTPRAPSDYRIRRQPAPFCVSTIEALAEVLTAIEPEAGPFSRLLDPFRAMVATQERFMAEVRSSRHRHAGPRPPRQPSLPARVAELWPRLVCVQGDANAWPSDDPDHQEPEIIHWVAHRPAAGATFEAVVAPRRKLSSSTPAHCGLAVNVIEAGCGDAQWRARWDAFRRSDDVLVSWGAFYPNMAARDGLQLPSERVDLRTEMSQMLRRRVGTLDDGVGSVGATPMDLAIAGRAGARLAALVAAVTALRAAGT